MTIIDRLLASEEPAIRLKVLTNVLGEEPTSAKVRRLQQQVKSCQRVKQLLSERDNEGRIPFHPYKKWFGAHWVLAALADLGYPPGDPSLVPLRDQVYEWLLSKHHEKKIPCIEGRTRRCASQEGNAIHASLALGLADSRTDELAERLMKWQWADGGWNCDKKPSASHSSFMETLIPLRALTIYAEKTGNRQSRAAARNAAEVFLQRRLFKRRRDGEVIDEDFLKLHYPCYWHYDILSALKVLAEAGRINDKRCRDAFDLLESKRLPDGGFPAEGKYYRVTERKATGRSLVDWDGCGRKYMNEFVTADALSVLTQAGRWRD